MGTPPCRWALAAWASTSHPPRAPLVPSRQPRQPRHRASNRPRHPPQRAPPSSSSTRRWPYSRRSRTRPRTSSPRCSPGPSSPKSSPASPSPRRPRGRRQPSSPRSPSCLAVGVYARVSRCALSLSLSLSLARSLLSFSARVRVRVCVCPLLRTTSGLPRVAALRSPHARALGPGWCGRHCSVVRVPLPATRYGLNAFPPTTSFSTPFSRLRVEIAVLHRGSWSE